MYSNVSFEIRISKKKKTFRLGLRWEGHNPQTAQLVARTAACIKIVALRGSVSNILYRLECKKYDFYFFKYVFIIFLKCANVFNANNKKTEKKVSREINKRTNSLRNRNPNSRTSANPGIFPITSLYTSTTCDSVIKYKIYDPLAILYFFLPPLPIYFPAFASCLKSIITTVE